MPNSSSVIRIRHQPSRSVVVLLFAVLTALVPALATAAPSAPSVTSPTGMQQQVEADRPIPVPPTHSCTETIAKHDFGNSYGAPYVGSYQPPAACAGPWNTVVLTLTGSVGQVQFDRDVYVAVGGAVLLDGSTSEPCCTGSNDITWTVQRDVTQDTALLQHDQPVVVELDNVNDSTYTGVYHVTVNLTFYGADAKHPAPATPDAVLRVSASSTSSPMLSVSAAGQQPGADVTFPRNLVHLSAELFADAHGPCEEFWWSDPENCAGSPYREVAIYIDGQLAGAAPAYPVTYTGADGPGLWEPIPSPRAWNLRPYDLDLTPFVGELTDGQPHHIALGILDATYTSGDFWAVAANLDAVVGPSNARTQGALTAVSAPAAPTDTLTDPDPSGASVMDTTSHALSFTGWVMKPRGRVTTTVNESMGESATETAATVNGRTAWTQSSTTAGPNNDHMVHTDHATYLVRSADLTNFDFRDNGSSLTTVGGEAVAASAYDETMNTANSTGLAFNGVEHERYRYADSGGACYDRILGAVAGEIAVDRTDARCPAVPT